MEELIGQTLGQYQIEAKIGQGGMATVFRARQQGLNRLVAVKVLPPNYAEERGFAQRFKREAQAIAGLEHPNILPVYDYGQQGQYSYLVMRYIEGSRTLGSVMRQSLSYNDILHYLKQIAAALDYAHQHHIIHRDIKPGNILLADKWVFLADFGLAHLIEATTHLTQTGTAMGTPAYMSPEQSLGQKIDVRTDVYAVGAMAYQMFTGQIPHQATTPHAIIHRRVTEPPPSLRLLNPDIPLAIDQCVQTALATLPENRFNSSGVFISALEHAIGQANAHDFKTTIQQVTPQTNSKPPSSTSSGPKQLCPNCHNKIPAGVTFCTICGHSIAAATQRPNSSPSTQFNLNNPTTSGIVIGVLAVLLLLSLGIGGFFMFNQMNATPVISTSIPAAVIVVTATPTETTLPPTPTNTVTIKPTPTATKKKRDSVVIDTPTPLPTVTRRPTKTRIPIPTETPTLIPTRVPTKVIPQVFGSITKGQICNNRCIDKGSQVDLCIWSNFPTNANANIYYSGGGRVGNQDLMRETLNNDKKCMPNAPMNLELGSYRFNVISDDGPSSNINFCIDDC